jgi:phenylalanyl-tRNA synthetase beta chain
MSHGMLASAKELAIGDNHEGLLEIDVNVEPGSSFAETYKLNDYIIELENKMFTHRPDCFGILGIAREISGIEGLQFVSPEWYKEIVMMPVAGQEILNLEVENQIPELVPRFVALAINNVVVRPSPIQIQSYLSRVGIRPINNLVDVTNFMMVLTGQPLHVYDYDKLKSESSDETPKIVICKAQKNEKLNLLNGKQISLENDDIAISLGHKVIGLGGVMGGSKTEVDKNTKAIVLECASFDMYSIRRTSMKYGIFSDAVTRFTKGQSVRQNLAISLKSLSLILELAGGQLASPVIDNKTEIGNLNQINITAGFINSRLGSHLSLEEIKNILCHVEMKVEVNQEELNLTPPFWRTDIEIPEDIVEEVGRIHGYSKLEDKLPIRSIKPALKNSNFELNNELRNVLSSAGANELEGNSFVHGDLLRKVNQNPEIAYMISNAISPDLQYFRLSLTPSLLESVYPNIRSNQVVSEDNEFGLFEIERFHSKADLNHESLPNEHRSLAFVFSADSKTSKRKYDGAAYFMAKKYLHLILDKYNLAIQLLPLTQVSSDILQNQVIAQIIAPFDVNRSAVIMSDDVCYGIIGEFKTSTKKSLKLPEFTSGFEITLNLFDLQSSKTKYKNLPKFPKIHQDICFRVPSQLSYTNLFSALWDEIEKNKPDNTYFELGALDIFKKPDQEEFKQITFRLLISAYDRTLTTDLINELVSKVANKLNELIGSELI